MFMNLPSAAFMSRPLVCCMAGVGRFCMRISFPVGIHFRQIEEPKKRTSLSLIIPLAPGELSRPKKILKNYRLVLELGGIVLEEAK